MDLNEETMVNAYVQILRNRVRKLMAFHAQMNNKPKRSVRHKTMHGTSKRKNKQ